MFSSASGSRGRATSVLGLMILGTLALAFMPGSVSGYEGIQGEYAIFYPTVELVYYHTDNLFLQPDNEVDANTFIVRPKFLLEVPTDRHYFSLEYVPQYRDIDEFDLKDEISHFLNIKGVFQGSPIFRVEVEDNFVRGVLETSEFDQNQERFLGLDPFISNNAKLDFIWEGQRQGVDIWLGHSMTDFERDEPTELDPAPAFVETDTFRVGMEYFYKFTPLTSFLVGYQYENIDEDFSKLQEIRDGFCVGGDCLVPGLYKLGSDANNVWVGFDGELGRTTTGTIRVGFRARDYDENVDASEFGSLFVDGTFTKAFTRFTKLEINLHRSDNVSNFEGNAYYSANRISLALTNQPIGRRVFWSIGGGFQRNNYPDPVGDVNREDDILMANAEVGYFPLTHLNVKLNYRFRDRDTNLPNSTFDYEENAIIFQLGLGF